MLDKVGKIVYYKCLDDGLAMQKINFHAAVTIQNVRTISNFTGKQIFRFRNRAT